VAEIRYGTRVVRKTDGGSLFPVYGGGGATFCIDEFNRENCFIVSRFGMSAECVRYVSGRFFLNDSGLTVHTTSDEVVQEFLDRYLVAKQTEIYALSRGTAQRNLDVSQFRALPISYPKSLEEQRRIVAVLDEAFAAIATATANAEKNFANARELSAMFPNSGSQEDSRLTIGELLERRWLLGHMDGNHGGDYPRKDEFVDAGVTYLSANCIRDGLVDFGRAKFLTAERASKLRKGFAKNRDVLFAHNATVGPVALLQTNEDFVVLGTSLTYYRCDEAFLLPEYLASYLRSPAFVEQYSSVMRQSTRNQVPITKQREFYMDVPPIAVQRHLVASLTGLQEDGRTLATLCKAKREALTALKQSLLHRAFSGELTEREPLAA
jgi:type I restriction enzyme S subunit